MAWTVRKRNTLITGSTVLEKTLKVAWNIKDALVAEGWTVIGSGMGTGSGSYNWGGADLWTAAPTLDGAWVALENADGVQLLLMGRYFFSGDWQNPIYMAWSEITGYTGTGCDEDTWPDRGTPPTDEISFGQDAYIRGCYGTGDFYLQVATSDDDCSFYSWAKMPGYSYYGFAAALVKLLNTKTLDTRKYWGWRFAQSSGNSAWIYEKLTNKTSGSPTFCGRAYHPVGGLKDYRILELYKSGGSVPLFESIGPDPVSTREQLLECLIGCSETSYYHLKGELPDMYRCSRNRAVGDTFDSYKYVCVGDYVLPWGSSTAML